MASEIEGIDRLIAKLSKMTPRVRAAAKKLVEKNARAMAAEMRAIAPMSMDGDQPGRLRDSIHVEEGRLGDVSMVVIADARDDKGRPYAAPVELGHTAENGAQVPAEPFFYSVVRARKKKIKRSIAGGISRAIKADKAAGG